MLDDLFAEIDAAAHRVKRPSESLKGSVNFSEKKISKISPRSSGKCWSAARTVGGEFSKAPILPITDFKSVWDRERCQCPSRTYPSRGTVSAFYNPVRTSWVPTSSQSREFANITNDPFGV